jgi:beta-N-acetylhexosaminidase
MRRSRAIYGCGGPVLSPDEQAFFRDCRPWGFILFARNIENPEQVRCLVRALRDTVEDNSAPPCPLPDRSGRGQGGAAEAAALA